MSDSIQVAIKVRPLIKREINENLQVQWTVQGNVIAPNDSDLRKRGEGSLQFDHIFDSDRKNTDVFEVVVKPIVDAAIKGFNGTVFAYGQTSSGKTHTMFGTLSEPGIIPLAVEHMFEAIASTFGREFLLRVSYMEIYNEKVNDLLDTNSTDLRLREDNNGLVQVLNCKEEVTSTPEGILNIMKKGDKNRRTGETDMNDRSSRSHTIFRITIESRETTSDSDGAIQVSQLNLVDLAGSERARQTGATGERFKEGTHINMSLLTLGVVIKQLSESNDSQKYVNFRDSKLTRILQASLGGNAMTTIICAVTPAALEETQCTLWFASRAKSVKNKPQLNEVMSDAALLKRYKKQLDKLNAELEKIKVINRTDEVQEMESKLQEKESRLQEKERLNQLLEERIELLKSGIVSGNITKENSVQKFEARRRRTWAGGPDRIPSPRFNTKISCLPTIQELSGAFSESNPNSPEKPTFCPTFKERAKRRQSIIQVDLANQTFETELADFELELIQNEKERVAEWDENVDNMPHISRRPKKEKVKFMEEVAVFEMPENDQITPEKKNKPQTEKSPGTPKSVLRERLSYLTDEYTSLQEYTTLERQMIATENGDKLQMLNKIHKLTKQVESYDSSQNELQERNAKLQNQLTIAVSCIDALNNRMPDIPSELKESLQKAESSDSDFDWSKLLEFLTDVNEETYVTPLEKELSDKYNECLQELEKTRAEKEKIVAEFATQTTKLKSTQELVENLKSDTDCLMIKLLQKGSELSKLKEQLVQLEKLNEELKETKLDESHIEGLEISKAIEVQGIKSVTISKTTVIDSDSNHQKELQTENQSIVLNDDKSEISQKLHLLELENAEMKSLVESYKLILSKETDQKNSSDDNEKLRSDLNEKDNEIQTMQSNIDNLNEKILKLESEVEVNKEEISTNLLEKEKEMNEKVKKLEEIKSELETDIVDSNKKLSLLEIENLALKDQIATLEIKLKELETKVSEKSEWELEKRSISEELNLRNKNIEELNITNSTLEKKVVELEEKLTNQRENVNNRANTINENLELIEQQENLEDVQTLLQLTLQCEMDESRDKIVELTECNTNLINKCTDLEIRLKSYEEQNLIPKENGSTTNENIIKFETENQTLLNYISKLEDKIKSLEGKSQETAQTSKHEECIVNIKEENLDPVDTINEERNEQQENLDDVQTLLQLTFQCEMEDSKNAILELTKSNENLINKCTEMENQLKSYEGEISNVTTHKENGFATTENRNLTDYVAKLEEKIKSLEEISNLKTECEDWELQKKLLTEEIDTKTKEIEELTNNCQEQLSSYKDELSALQTLNATEKQAFDNELNLKVQELEKITAIKEDLNKSVEELQRRIVELEQECEKRKNHEENLEIAQSQDSNAEVNQEFLIRELNEKIEELTSKNLALESDISTSDAKISQLESDKHKMKDHVSDMEAQLNTFEEVISALKENIELAKENLETEDIKSQIKILSDEVAEKTKDIEKLNLLKNVLEKYIDESRKMISELKEQNNNLKDEITLVDDQVQHFESQLLSLQSAIDEIDIENEDLDTTIDLLVPSTKTEQLDNKENYIANMESKIRTLRKKIAALRQMKNEETQTVVSLELKIAELTNAENKTSSVNHENEVKEVLFDSLQKENEELRKQLENLENKFSDLRAQVTEYEALVHKLEEDKVILTNLKERQIKSVDSPAAKSVKARAASDKSELEFSSIFENNSYFDQMHNDSKVSTFIDESFEANMDESHNSTLNKDMSTCSEKFFDTSEGGLSNVTMKMNDSQTMENQDVNVNESFSVAEDSSKIHELVNERLALCEENEKLNCTLRLKIQEAEDIQNDIMSLKQGMENLQQTVLLLTSENVETSKQLTQERERYDKTVHSLQNEIDELRSRLSQVTEEKVLVENEVALLTEQLENLRSVSPVATDDEMKNKMSEYQIKIKSLTEENIGLSSDLMEKLEELDKVKESRVQLYEHECAYKEKNESLLNRIEYVEKENIELSNNLTEQIEECDNLKESLEMLNRKLEIYSSRNEPSNDLDLDELRRENNRLNDECIELQAKLGQIMKENANLSMSMHLDSPEQTPRKEEDVSIRSFSLNPNATLLHGSLMAETFIEDGPSSANYQELQERIEHLTLLNKKLSDLKLTSCSQCAHLKELNESRRALKLEVKSLNGKLGNLRKQFERKCQDVDVLRIKASEDFNSSLSMLDTTLNTSILDGANVSFIEEKVNNLQEELEDLKDNHDKLSSLYKEKCDELEKLQSENYSPPSHSSPESKPKVSTIKTSQRLKNMEKTIEELNGDLQELKKRNSETSAELQKYMPMTKQEIALLKSENEELKKHVQDAAVSATNVNEKLRLCEEEMMTLYKDIEKAKIAEKELCTKKLNVEVHVESLIGEKLELVARIDGLIAKHKKELEESKLSLTRCTEENTDLKKAVTKLQDQLQSVERTTEKEVEREMTQALQDELELAKSRIMKEVKSLKPTITHQEYVDLSNKSVSDTFATFLHVIMTKEGEIIKELQEEFERQKRKLVDEKQQCCDAERRASVWAKTLEADMEKCQNDLAEQETKNKKLQEVMSKLEKIVKDSNQENQQLKDRVSALEGDVNTLHGELEKKSKANIHQDTAINAAQEQQRLAKSKEAELEKRISLEKEKYNAKIDELGCLLESLKSKNLDLLNTVEGLEINEKHLKNIINMKTNEISTANRTIEELKSELENIGESCRQLNTDVNEKAEKIETITNLLKNKCDLLAEYKTKLETMKPEYEALKEQAEERKLTVERLKSEVDVLRIENAARLNKLNDELSAEKINSAGLSKQLAEMVNKHTALSDLIEEMREKTKELERDNERLQRKVRNSTSKARVEIEMEELHDENRTLKNNLDGAYNRITELQESKAQVLRDLIDIRGKHELAVQELASNQKLITNLREKVDNSEFVETSDKYESLLQEKNSTKLELEEKKLLLLDREKKMNELGNEVEALQKKNKELDDEMEDMVKVIHKQDTDNSRLETKVFDLEDEIEKLKQKYSDRSCNTEMSEGKDKLLTELQECRSELETLREKNKELDEEMDEMVAHIHKQEDEIASLRDELITGGAGDGNAEKLKALEEEVTRLKIDLKSAELQRARCDDQIVRLTAEKQILLVRVEELDNKLNELESRNSSKGSSRCVSPVLQDTSHKNRRRQRRSDLFNEKRHLEPTHEVSEVFDTSTRALQDDCVKCAELREKIRELSVELVSRNNKITMLEVQIQTENYPYQTKCKDLQETLLTFRKKNSELKVEVQKLQRALMEDSARECTVCRHWKLNKRDQAVQCTTENKIFMSGMSSGLVEEHLRIQKIEKEKALMKDVCRARARKIQELEERIKELETADFIDQPDVN